ncbi:receptor-like kinase, partial [Trifolium medium]|nr:receptor-like kinase [Trifolium medium]
MCSMAELGHSKLITLLLLLLLVKSGGESSCGPDQPRVRFPFQLVKGPQDRCAFPEFCLYCDDNKNTILSLPTTSGPIKFLVGWIEYKPQSCLPMKFLKLNSSSFLSYQFYSLPVTNITFLNCSSVKHPPVKHLRRQDMFKCPIYVSNSYDSVLELGLESCTKMFEARASASVEELPYKLLNLSWPKPDCSECEAKGKRCRWNQNSTKGDIECFDSNGKRISIHIPKFLIFVAT